MLGDSFEFKIDLKTRVLVTTMAGLLGFLIIFGAFILVKYLFIRSECQRVPMMVFYALTICNLGARMAIMIELNYEPFISMKTLILSVISLMFALMVGLCHAFILSTLIMDLKMLKCETEKDYNKVVRLMRIYRVGLLAWVIILVVNVVLFIVKQKYSFTMLAEAILFTVQAVGLLGINAQLNRVLSGLFNSEQFRSERRFLKCTLVLFTLSYFVVVVRSFLFYYMIVNPEINAKEWVCKNNDKVNLFNVASWLVIDVLPLGTIFCLHWRNFRAES